MTERTALLAEDDEAVAVLVQFVLEREGFTVRHAADGREALKQIDEQEAPALAVLDIMMPHASGHELVDAIRASETWADTPIIMLTAKTAEADVVRALDAGANDYIPKPFAPEELAARIRRVVKAPRR